MTVNDVIQHITTEFLENLEAHTCLYKVIGMSDSESPMWIQFQNFNEDKTAVVFRSSQRDIGFEVPITPEMFETVIGTRQWAEVYDHFKRVKYEHLRDNHPTVFNELDYHLPRINAFLSACSN